MLENRPEKPELVTQIVASFNEILGRSIEEVLEGPSEGKPAAGDLIKKFQEKYRPKNVQLDLFEATVTENPDGRAIMVEIDGVQYLLPDYRLPKRDDVRRFYDCEELNPKSSLPRTIYKVVKPCICKQSSVGKWTLEKKGKVHVAP